MFQPTRALPIGVEGRAGEEISMQSILLKLSWKDDILGLDRIRALAESYSEGRAGLRIPSLQFVPNELAEL